MYLNVAAQCQQLCQASKWWMNMIICGNEPIAEQIYGVYFIYLCFAT